MLIFVFTSGSATFNIPSNTFVFGFKEYTMCFCKIVLNFSERQHLGDVEHTGHHVTHHHVVPR